MASQRNYRRPWIEVGRELTGSRPTILTALSFLLPLLLWSVVSYVPFIWHPDIELSLPVTRADSTSVYVPGDHVGRDFFGEFQEAIRTENAATGAIHAGTTETAGSSRRDNIKQLRQLSPLAVAHGWITSEQERDTAAMFDVWGGLATGRLVATDPALTEENLELVRRNWALLSASGDRYDKDTFPELPLYKLVPQGRLANPDYLPEPHKALLSGIRAFTKPVDDGQPTMAERTAHSVNIVFTGFLISCVIGIPLGVLCGSIALFSKLVEPFVDFFRYMPAPTFSTVLVAILAVNDGPKVAMIVLGTVFQMILVLAKTTRLLDRSLLEAAQTLGASQKHLLFRVTLPGILPNLYNDLRIMLGWAWTWLVIAELIGVKSGLTEFIETQGRWRNFDNVYPIIILIGLIGYFTDQFLAWLHRPLFPWLGEPAGPVTRGVIRVALWIPRWFMNAAKERSVS